MSDPVERLTRLGDALHDAPMPLPASEIRARGDVIRRRKHAIIGAVSAAIVAVVAVPVVAITLNESDDRPPPIAPRPTVSDPGSSQVGEGNLLTGGGAIYPNGRADWREADTISGDPGATSSPCARASLTDLGAASELQRSFDFLALDSDDVDPTVTFTESVGQFDTREDARAAYETIQRWYDNCLPAGADSYSAGYFSRVPIGVTGRAVTQVATYGPVDESLDPNGNEVSFLDTGLILSGDRLAVLTQVTHGQDYDWPGGTPVKQMLPVAAERLVLGNGGQSEPEPSSGGPAEDPTAIGTIPDGVPIDLDLIDMTDDSGTFREPHRPGATEPAVDVTLCGEQLWPVMDGVGPAFTDELVASATGPQYEDRRDLVAFPTADAAAGAVQAIRDALEICNRVGDVVWTEHPADTGHDSVTFSRTYGGLGLTVYQVTRVGNAVLLTLGSTEGNLDTAPAFAEERTVITRKIANEMCALNEGGLLTEAGL